MSPPMSVLATLRPGIIVSANACSVASSIATAASAGSAAIIRSARGSAAATNAPAPRTPARRMKSLRDSSSASRRAEPSIRGKLPQKPARGVTIPGYPRAMSRAIATAGAALAVAASIPQLAEAQSGVVGWDGTNPFACTLQEVGGGTNFPEPNADPFCVEYDKRHQNVDKLGVVDFLSKEPRRFAVASPKCFYFQRDHWVGSVSEGVPQSQTYAWDGDYYFDKAKGTGGAYVENFSIGGQSGDPTLLPGFPSQYKPFFGNGRGGVRIDNEVPADPSCAAKAKKHNPYVTSGPGGGSGAKGLDRCRVPGGTAGRGSGGIRLGPTRPSVVKTLGAPTKERLA